MSDFKVTPAVLKSQADELAELNARYNLLIDKLVTSEQGLHSMWTGEANDAFHNAFNIDRGKMEEFYRLIVQYIDRLRNICLRYEQTETTNTEIASTRSY